MGIDISGSMLVGAHGDDIAEPEDYDGDFIEWIEECEMDIMPEHYDADESCTYYGFGVKDVLVSEMDGAWLDEVKQLAIRFEELTGEPAHLIGCQRVW